MALWEPTAQGSEGPEVGTAYVCSAGGEGCPCAQCSGAGMTQGRLLIWPVQHAGPCRFKVRPDLNQKDATVETRKTPHLRTMVD